MTVIQRETVLLLLLLLLLSPAQRSIARVILFTVMSVCDSVYLFVCQHDNSRTVTDIITNFSAQGQKGGQVRKWL